MGWCVRETNVKGNSSIGRPSVAHAWLCRGSVVLGILGEAGLLSLNVKVLEQATCG